MKKLFILLILAYGWAGITTEEPLFSIKQVYAKGKSKGAALKKRAKPYDDFYKTDTYTYERTCFGEFGGYLVATEKNTGAQYACLATCPLSIVEYKHQYVASASLNHLMGSTHIFTFEGPEHWKAFDSEKNPHVHSNPNFSKGCKSLIDTFGLLTLGQFSHDGKLYFITADDDRTYLSKIEGKKLVHVQQLYDQAVSLSETLPYFTKDEKLIIDVNQKGFRGFIEVSNSEINMHHF